jgi:hypothetical protein
MLFADVTSVIVYHHEKDHFQNCINCVFGRLNKWFKARKLTLNIGKTNFMKFGASKRYINLNISCANRTV